MLKGHSKVKQVYTKYRRPLPAYVWVAASELPEFGWLRFVELGEENVYFATRHGYTLCVKRADMLAYSLPVAG